MVPASSSQWLRRWLAAVVLFAAAPGVYASPGQPSPATSEPQAQAGRTLPRSLPVRRDEAPAGLSLQWLFPLGVLLALAGGAVVLVRRRAGVSGISPFKHLGRDPHLARLASQALTPHASVHVVRWGTEELLLGCTSQQVRVIARRPAGPASGAAQ
jgi:flagellar biogenesis protein FliO